MKIAACLPLKIDPEKSMLVGSLGDMRRVCDELIILWDNDYQTQNIGEFTEVLRVWSKDGSTWNDWSNRCALLARAAKYGCRWVMNLDDDETLGPLLSRSRIHELCAQAEESGSVCVMPRVRTAWNATHWRADGIFGDQRKPLLQLNPFMLKSATFEYGPEQRLHCYPIMAGPRLSVDDYLIHWGMRTQALREKNVSKYEAADPEREFSNVRYDYLLDEASIDLRPLYD